MSLSWFVCSEVLSGVYSYNRYCRTFTRTSEGGEGLRAGGVRERESTGNRDGESEAIWKVISSLNAVYLFINERKVFSERGRQREEIHLCLLKPSLFQRKRTDSVRSQLIFCTVFTRCR